MSHARTFIVAEGFAKATHCCQSMASHRHIGPNHVAHRSILRRHTPVSTSYYPIELIRKPGWTASTPEWLDLAPDTDYLWACIACSQVLYPIWLCDSVIIQKSYYCPLRHCHSAVASSRCALCLAILNRDHT